MKAIKDIDVKGRKAQVLAWLQAKPDVPNHGPVHGLVYDCVTDFAAFASIKKLLLLPEEKMEFVCNLYRVMIADSEAEDYLDNEDITPILVDASLPERLEALCMTVERRGQPKEPVAGDQEVEEANDGMAKGGRGMCSFCRTFQNNLSYHEAHECVKRPR